MKSPINLYNRESYLVRTYSDEFLVAQNIASKRHAIQKIIGLASPLAFAVGAQLEVDMAVGQPKVSQDEKAEHIANAVRHATAAVHRTSLEDYTATTHLRSRLLLADIPLSQAIALQHDYPDTPALRSAYAETVGVLHEAMRATQNPAVKNTKVETTIFGLIFEGNVKALFNRFALHNGLRDYLATGSLYSEDNARAVDPEAIPSDIKVYAGYGNAVPKQTYSVQVKASRLATSLSDVDHDTGDVTLIQPNMLSTRQLKCTIGQLTSHLIGEWEWGNEASTKPLDAWTGRLLNKIDA